MNRDGNNISNISVNNGYKVSISANNMGAHVHCKLSFNVLLWKITWNKW